MADGVELDVGSGGDLIAADDAGAAGKVQIVKLAYSADGEATTIPADATGLDVDVKAIAAGDALVGRVKISDGTDVALVTGDGELTTLDKNSAALLTAAQAIETAVEGTLTVGSHAVTNGGTFAVQVDGNALTALQLIDDVVYADDADWTDDTSKHALVGGVYQATPHTVTDGDVTPFLADVNGRLAVADGGGTLSIDDGGGAITVDGTVAVTNAGLTELAAAIDTELQVDVVGALPAGDNNIGNVDIASIAAGDNNIGNVDVASSVLPTGAATSANQTTIIGHLDGVETTLTTIDGRVDGIEALLATIDTDTGNIDTKLGTLDNIVPSINGPLGFTAVDSYTQVAINLAAAANQSLVAAPGASKQIWVYGVTFVVNAAGTVSFQDEDDAAISGVMPFAANSGLAIAPSGNFSMPLWKLATNKALEVDVVTSEIDGFLTYAVMSV